MKEQSILLMIFNFSLSIVAYKKSNLAMNTKRLYLYFLVALILIILKLPNEIVYICAMCMDLLFCIFETYLLLKK